MSNLDDAIAVIYQQRFYLGNFVGDDPRNWTNWENIPANKMSTLADFKVWISNGKRYQIRRLEEQYRMGYQPITENLE